MRDLVEFAGRLGGVRWLTEGKKFRADCPGPSHGIDTELSLFANVVNNSIAIACFKGCNQAGILECLELKRADLNLATQNGDSGSHRPADEPHSQSEPRFDSAAGATSNGTNGHHTPDLATWKLRPFHLIQAILKADAIKAPELMASCDEGVLLESALGDLHRALAAGHLSPLPDLNESEIEEELEAAALGAIREFKRQHTARPSPPPPGGAGPAAPEEKVKALDLDQLYELIDEWEKRPWVWDGILPSSSLSLLVGKSETGKSTFVYALIYAIVTGSEFCGRQCEPGRVLYLAGDPMSEVVAGRTFRSFGLREGVKVIPESLVSNPTGLQQLTEIIREFKPALVVGDTLAATVDTDVDKYGQSYQSQQPLVKIARELGPNFLMLHHSQKSAVDSYSVIDAALGSVGVAAVASTRMVTRVYRRGGNKYHTFEMSNLRIGKPLLGEFIVRKYDDGNVDLMGLWKTENAALDKGIIIKVLERQNAPIAKRTLWQECRPKPKWEPFNDALEELLAAGKISMESGPRGGKLFKLS